VPRLASDTRWTWIFATILILVVVVVIGFLSGITSALSSIDKALGTTDADLVDVNKDADPLPGYVAIINKNLVAIDKALKPIPGQGVSILGSLTSINRSTGRVNAALTTTNSSLLDTSSSLVNTGGQLGTITSSLQDTSGSLKGTTNVLVTIRGTLRSISGVLVNVDTRAKQINSELHAAQSPSSNGTGAIVGLVPQINTDLKNVNNDTTPINTGLNHTHDHLTSICKSTLLSPLGTQC
jgi:methyl-accepting chemotaxis protein